MDGGVAKVLALSCPTSLTTLNGNKETNERVLENEDMWEVGSEMYEERKGGEWHRCWRYAFGIVPTGTPNILD